MAVRFAPLKDDGDLAKLVLEGLFNLLYFNMRMEWQNRWIFRTIFDYEEMKHAV